MVYLILLIIRQTQYIIGVFGCGGTDGRKGAALASPIPLTKQGGMGG
jgi:hypothetical protein